MERLIDINSINKRSLQFIRELSNSIKERSNWNGKLSNLISERSNWITELSNRMRALNTIKELSNWIRELSNLTHPEIN